MGNGMVVEPMEPPLPEGWVWTKLEECVDILDNRRVPINSDEREQRIAGKDQSELYPYYGATGLVGWIDDFIFDEEIVLLGEDGAPFLESKNKAYLVRGKCWVNNHAHVLRAKKDVTTNLYLMHYLNIFDYHGYVTGTTRLKLNQGRMREFPVILPPLPEQERIVARLEELLSDLEAGVAALERVRAGVKRYKASVLKAACEGQLVAQDPSDEPAEISLRKLGERPIENDAVDSLPNGWCWVKWSQIGVSQNGRSFPSKEYQAEGIKLLRPGNLFASGEIVWTESNTRHMPEKWEADFPNFIVEENELIINLTAQSLKDEFLGRVCITGPGEHCLLNQRLARLTQKLGEKRYFLWLFKSELFRHFVDGLNTGSLIQHMFTSQLADFVLPFPPLEEQRRIVVEVERRLESARAVESAVDAGLKRAARLRQAVLRSAFEGRLGWT